jgi:hypothetical protein
MGELPYLAPGNVRVLSPMGRISFLVLCGDSRFAVVVLTASFLSLFMAVVGHE